MFLKTMNDPDLYNVVVGLYTIIQRGNYGESVLSKTTKHDLKKSDVVCYGSFTHGHVSHHLHWNYVLNKGLRNSEI